MLLNRESIISRLEPVRFQDIIAKLPPLRSLPSDKLKRLCEIREILDKREEEYQLLYYKPQPQQVPFHKSGKKIRLVAGSNQSGKSVAGCVEGLWLALGIHPYKKMQIPNKGRVIAADLTQGIGEIIQSQLDKWLPKNELAGSPKKGPTGVISKLKFKNGSSIDFLSNEQEDKAFEGWVGNWVWGDEPMRRNVYTACLRGLMSRKGMLWITMTPLTEPWIYDEIFVKGGNADIDVFHLDIKKNFHISAEEVRKFEEHLTPEEREARLLGKFPHLAGLIHKTFNIKTHCIPSFKIPKDWPRYMALDYHPRKPCSVVWATVNPSDRLYNYEELVVDATVSRIAEMIKAKEEEECGKNANIRMRWIDPLSSMPDRISGSCPLREFGRCGIRCRGWTKNFTVGRNAIDEYLALDKEGQPGIYFFSDKVPQVINSYLHYQWGEFSSERIGEKEMPKQKFSDLPDAVRGIIVNRPTHNLPQIEQARDEYYAHPVTGYGH